MKWWFGFVGLLLLVSSFGLAGCNQTPVRSDAQVAAEIHGKLQSDGRISSRNVEVQADHGVVTLTGNVSSDDERATVATDAATVASVKTVVNNLVVQQAQAVPLAERESPATRPVATSPVKKPIPQVHRKSEASAQQAVSPGPDKSDAPQVNAPPSSAEPVMAQAPPPPKKITIPAGTQITIRLNDTLDTERSQVGDTFHATLGVPVVIDSETALPSGADVVGRIVDVKSAGRFAGNSALTLELSSLSVNGKTYNIQTNQWSRQGKGEGKNTAVKAGGGAAIGALIGGLAGKGAAIGAGAGAGAGTGAAATKKGEQIKLAPESTLSFLLINTVTVTQQAANNRNAARTQLP